MPPLPPLPKAPPTLPPPLAEPELPPFAEPELPPVPNAPLDVIPEPPAPIEATQLPFLQVSPEGHIAPSQSSLQVPETQCFPASQETPTHDGSTHWPLPESHAVDAGQGAQLHEATQTPSWQTWFDPQDTPAHGSTQAPTRQTWG